jgi:thymidylate kinase
MTNSRNIKYIEIFGLPGTGKSTLCLNLKNRYIFKKRIKTLREVEVRLLLKSIICSLNIINIILFRIVRAFIQRKLDISLMETIGFINAIIVCYYMYHYALQQENTLICDHGFIQTLTQNKFFRRELITDEKLLRRIISNIPTSYSKYIYLKADIQTARDRAFKRCSATVKTTNKYEEDYILFERIMVMLPNIITINSNQPLSNVLSDFNDIFNN